MPPTERPSYLRLVDASVEKEILEADRVSKEQEQRDKAILALADRLFNVRTELLNARENLDAISGGRRDTPPEVRKQIFKLTEVAMAAVSDYEQNLLDLIGIDVAKRNEAIRRANLRQ